MLQELVNRNEDLRKLQDAGFEMEMIGGYLVIHHIPYVANVSGTPKAKDDGKLVIKLNLSGNLLNNPIDHTAYFVGLYPCNIDGTQITGLVNSSQKLDFGRGMVDVFYLSNKPTAGIETSYYEKTLRYESIISRPAEYMDKTLTARTFNPIRPDDNTSPFKYVDTMSSRYDLSLIHI